MMALISKKDASVTALLDDDEEEEEELIFGLTPTVREEVVLTD
jgi:hypothetical protein